MAKDLEDISTALREIIPRQIQREEQEEDEAERPSIGRKTDERKEKIEDRAGP